jgi:sugar lactone lactonase YvrE
MQTLRYALFVLLLTIWAHQSLSAQGNSITTVAGTGQAGFAGDSGPASSALLHSPGSVAADNNGNLYIADLQNERIRKVSIDGKITTVAGTGHRGFSGDGGLAINASLDMAFNPINAVGYFVYDGGLAVDDAGRVYIADSNNHRIRKIDLDGVITTIAGTGDFGYVGDGGPAVLAALSFPSNLTIDRVGNIYIADTGNRVIRKISPDGTINTAAKGFLSPTGVAVNENGEIYVADPSFNYFGNVFKVDRQGTVSSISSRVGGEFWTGPRSVAVDPMGNIIATDTYNNVVVRISKDERTLTTIAGGEGPAIPKTLAGPLGVSVDSSGTIYIADTDNHRVKMIATPRPTLTLNSGKYCTGVWQDPFSDIRATWILRLENAPPNTPIQLIGISNDLAWEVPAWRRTRNNGTFSETGVFAAGNEGEHTIRVRMSGKPLTSDEAGNSLSNTVSFNVSSCALR